jgi:hypothetical protein
MSMNAKLLAALTLFCAAHASEASGAGLCDVLKEADVSAVFGTGWTLTSAAPLGGDNTCYFGLQSKNQKKTAGVKVDPGANFDAMAAYLQDPKPAAGIGERAVLGRSGGAATLLVRAKGKTYSFSAPTDEAAKRLAALMLGRM